MFSQALKALLICSFLAFSTHAWSAEEEKKEDKKEEKKAEGGAEAKKESKPKGDDFNSVQAKVSALEAKVKAGNEDIDKLIEEKQATKDPQKIQEIVKQMVTAHKELEKNAKEYDQQRSLLKYRYPEKDQKIEREYERIEVKSLDEMEGQKSVSASIKHTLQNVRNQYGEPEKKESSATKAETKKEEKPKTTPLDEPVILSK